MSKVVITELIEGATANAADANATLTSWTSASTDIDDDNVREEGIERRTMKRVFQEFGDTNERDFTQGINGPPVPLQAVIEFSFEKDVGGFDYDAANGDQIVVRASFLFEITSADITAGGADTVLTGATGDKTGSGGAAAIISRTIRRYDAIPGRAMKGIYTATHYYAGATNSDLWLTLMVGITSSNAALTATIRNPYITAILYKR